MPFGDRDVSEGVGVHGSVCDFAEDALALGGADGDEIPTGLAIVVMFQANRSSRSGVFFHQHPVGAHGNAPGCVERRDIMSAHASFPRSAWKCHRDALRPAIARPSCDAERLGIALPTQSVGTIKHESEDRPLFHAPAIKAIGNFTHIPNGFYRTRMLSAWGPFVPCLTTNSTL